MRVADAYRVASLEAQGFIHCSTPEQVIPVAPKEELPRPRREVMDVEEEVISVSGAEPAERCWFSASYLLWWIKAANVPPLLTTGPTTDPRPGSLDSIFAMIRFGDEIDGQERHGARPPTPSIVH